MHTLFHIYGPIAIHSYGFMIALGLLCFIYLIQRDPRFHALHVEPYFNGLLIVGVCAALLGGRLLFFFTHPYLFENLASFFAFYKGGFSILGAVIAVLAALTIYLRRINIPMIPLFDLVSIYAPLLQSISRIGCFLAGCCYGIPTSLSWGVMYTDPATEAPLYTCVHPTQLYSATSLLVIFVFQYFVGRHYFKQQGMLVCSYLFLIALERFVVDFWRGDRIIDSWHISLNQYVAIGLMAGALIGFLYGRMTKS